uniref:Uncharacterized protein n=1 Tax=Anguilla anguilla TaxID=7936 RepID=A0A0E9VCT0_ANGAN
MQFSQTVGLAELFDYRTKFHLISHFTPVGECILLLAVTNQKQMYSNSTCKCVLHNHENSRTMVTVGK